MGKQIQCYGQCEETIQLRLAVPMCRDPWRPFVVDVDGVLVAVNLFRSIYLTCFLTSSAV
jgi:hypothetical protein